MERALTPPVTLRRATPADLDGIEALEEAAFTSDRLSRRSLRRFLAVPTTDTPVAAAGPDVVGYAMIGFRQGSRLGRLFSLAVDGARARQGLGGRLLGACEAAARARGMAAVRLEVREDNAGARRLYERAGYAPIGAYKDYYEDGAAALRFEKRLAGP